MFSFWGFYCLIGGEVSVPTPSQHRPLHILIKACETSWWDISIIYCSLGAPGLLPR